MSYCTEEKHLLNGQIEQYYCDLVYFSDDFGILRYVVPEDREVAGLGLPKGTITYGYYWKERPFLVYDWYYQGKQLGSYFSIIDRLQLNPTRFAYRDLVVDMLIDINLNIKVLDYDELPNDCDLILLSYINDAANYIQENYRAVLTEVTRQSQSYLNI